MDVFALSSLLDRQVASGEPYLEFLRVPDLSLGLYVLEAGEIDRQQPHTEDEAYVVLAGRSRFTAGTDAVREMPGVCRGRRGGPGFSFATCKSCNGHRR